MTADMHCMHTHTLVLAVVLLLCSIPPCPQGIEVLHFYQGRPLCTLPLSSYHASHADIDGDKTIEHVHAVVQAEEGQDEEGEGKGEELGTDCYGQAVRSTGKVGRGHPPTQPETCNVSVCIVHSMYLQTCTYSNNLL